MKEAQEHEAFCRWLDKQRLPFIHSRTDRKHTNTVGDPDFFVLLAGKALGLEFKVGKNKLSAAQEKRVAYLRQAGNPVRIVATASDAITATMEWAGVLPAATGDPGVNLSGQGTSSLQGGLLPKNEAGLAAQPLWIAGIYGFDYVFSGDPSPGGLATKIRRATPADLRELKKV